MVPRALPFRGLLPALLVCLTFPVLLRAQGTPPPEDWIERLREAEARLAALEGDAPPSEEGAGRVALGGYFDLEYRDGQGADPSFVQHRFVPQIDAAIGAGLHFSAEIEFEYGATDSARGDGETKVEFAALDWELAEGFTLRAGALLVPLGRFNEKHDSPLNDFTDRPLLARSVIPTTLTDAGVGGLGAFEVGEEGVVSWELYLLNGFVGLEADADAATGLASNFDTTSGLRGGRPSLKRDGSRGIAGAGRVEWSPRLGIELGVSAHHGAYDADGERDLLIAALDFDLVGAALAAPLAGFELNGEVARAEISRDRVARESGVPDDLWGFSLEVNRHFLLGGSAALGPLPLPPGSAVTAAVRLEHVELGAEREERITIGLNLRPIEETVLKLDYQFHFEDGDHRREENDAILLSIASYF